MANNYKFGISFIFIVLLGGCTANTGEYYSEATGNSQINMQTLSSGELRLGPAVNSIGAIGAKDDLKLLHETSSLRGSANYCVMPWQECPELNTRKDAAEFALKIIQRHPSGDDLTYFHLAWIAEVLSHPEAAYEYYNISKLLFDFDTDGLEYKSVIGSSVRAGAEVNISYCGHIYDASTKTFGWGFNSCPRDMRDTTLNAIRRLETSF